MTDWLAESADEIALREGAMATTATLQVHWTQNACVGLQEGYGIRRKLQRIFEVKEGVGPPHWHRESDGFGKLYVNTESTNRRGVGHCRAIFSTGST